MANYYCGCEPLKNTKMKDAKAHLILIQQLKEHELLNWLFNEDSLSTEGEVNDVVLIEQEMIDISLKLKDILIWVDIYASNIEIWRDYYLNGQTQMVEATLPNISFPDPSWTPILDDVKWDASLLQQVC